MVHSRGKKCNVNTIGRNENNRESCFRIRFRLRSDCQASTCDSILHVIESNASAASKEGILVSRRVMNERGPPAAALADPAGRGPLLEFQKLEWAMSMR